MEILALLLLGLIAMLAIVPPIIRGKLDESPLASTQSFQRSMQEMANSIDSASGRGESPHESRERVVYTLPPRGGYAARPHAAVRFANRKRAAIRRNRIMASLVLFAAIWGAAALWSGATWCLAVFAASCGILAVFWGVALIAPYLSPRPRLHRRPEKEVIPPRSQAL